MTIDGVDGVSREEVQAMSDGADRFLVRCRVSKGFFEGEVMVMVAGSSAYVSRGNVSVSAGVTDNAIDGLVRAYVIKEFGDRVLIELPGEPTVGGLRTWVASSEISAAV